MIWVSNPFDVNVIKFGDDKIRFQNELIGLQENQVNHAQIFKCYYKTNQY